jgi:hypothetical protein
MNILDFIIILIIILVITKLFEIKSENFTGEQRIVYTLYTITKNGNNNNQNILKYDGGVFSYVNQEGMFNFYTKSSSSNYLMSLNINLTQILNATIQNNKINISSDANTQGYNLYYSNKKINFTDNNGNTYYLNMSNNSNSWTTDSSAATIFNIQQN